MTMPTVDSIKRALASTVKAIDKVAASTKAGATLAEEQRQTSVPQAPDATGTA